MRLFSYYALHSLKNQLKKLFKTWVLIFIVACGLIGGLIGFGAASLSDIAKGHNETEISEEYESDAVDDTYTNDIPESSVPEDNSDSGSFKIPENITLFDMIELGIGLLILIVFIWNILGADKNGSKIFLPADVNLLFPSPMKPQSVLMFRLMTQIITTLMASLYLILQIPNLMSAGISPLSALALVFTWFFAIAIAKLLQVLCYTLMSTHSELKNYLRRTVYAVIAVIAVAYIAFSHAFGQDYLSAAAAFFNHPASRWIPFWGWLKGFAMSALEDNFPAVIIYAVILLVFGVLLIIGIWNIKADFYEDAMAKSEQTAELHEIAQAEKSVGFVRRKKDRSDKIRRDSMRHGSGANVFFYRSLYNRFRFAQLGFLTKTTETYFVSVIGITFLCKMIIHTDSYIPAVLTLGVMAFYRTLGNPLEEDTSKDFFRMIPESTWRKLYWSILGGTVNCLLDLIPAFIAIAVIFQPNPLVLLAWIPVILSVDFYGSNISAFINLSVPVSAGTIIKQIVQVMFIYFGLLPSIAIVAVGIVLDHLAIAALCTALLNTAIGLFFLALTPMFIDHKEIPVPEHTAWSSATARQAKKAFSYIGLGLFVIIAVSSILQIASVYLFPGLMDQTWGLWVLTFVPLYVIGIPLGILVFSRTPRYAVKKDSLSILQIIKAVFICMFMMFFGNIIGNIITTCISSILGNTYVSGLTAYVDNDSLLLKILFMSILAPIIEEYICRKQLIDRIIPYGEKLAVISSGLLFGLFHGNLTQFFYAFGIGLVFGYIYVKTGKLRYSIGLHIAINFFNGILASELVNSLNLEALDTMTFADMSAIPTSFILYLIYLAVMVIGSIIGLVLLCTNSRKILFRPGECDIPKGQRLKTAYINIGMLLFIAGSIAMIVLSLL